MRTRHFLLKSLLVVCTICPAVTGCSGGDGPPRYRLTGRITYDGKPVPRGWIIFAPKKGPGASANIENGRYEAPNGFGSIGGMHTIEIVAFDGVSTPDTDGEDGMNTPGNTMFTYTFTKDIPKEATTWDIEISCDDVTRNKWGIE